MYIVYDINPWMPILSMLHGITDSMPHINYINT